jgi:hypothetical protein
VPWNAAPVLSIEIDEKELKAKCGLDDRHQRVFQTVDLFSKAIVDARRDEESKPDVWFVVIPDYVRRYCRPEGIVAPADRHEWQRFFASARQAKELYQAPSLFADANVAAEPYFFKEHFRNQLKARLLEHRVATQILREGTLENIASTPQNAREAGLIKMQSQIAWNIATTAFYKSGGRPWKVDGIRKGVCYIGLVYKKDQRSVDNRMACCGAQMFLDSGDGVVFKGAVGPWHNTETGDFHLSAKAAHDLIEMAVKSYKERRPDRKPPDELFIHGKTTFNDQEWGGIRASCAFADQYRRRQDSRRFQHEVIQNRRHAGPSRHSLGAQSTQCRAMDARLDAAARDVSGPGSAEPVVDRDLSGQCLHRDGVERHHGADKTKLQCMPVRRWLADHFKIRKRGWGSPHRRPLAIWRRALAFHVLHLNWGPWT